MILHTSYLHVGCLVSLFCFVFSGVGEDNFVVCTKQQDPNRLQLLQDGLRLLQEAL